MAKGARAAATLALLGAMASHPAAANEPAPTIVLWVDNRSDIAMPSLLAAERHASAIYEQIGVNLVWAHREEAPIVRDGDLVLTVALLPRSGTEAILRRTRLQRHVLGAAPRQTGRAYIFCDRIAKVAQETRVFEATLGRVLAHEIGHLLLPGEGHSPEGIMQAKLELLSPSTPRFSESQGESIRTLLASTR
jgi:hypothetical protein